MTHISGFGLQNFRVFKEYSEIDFAPITIFTGPNNSGKSSVIKALNLIVDNLAGNKLFENLNFSHESKLGTYGSILANPKKGELVFVFKIDWPAKFLESSDWRLKLIFKTNPSSKNENGKLKEIVFFEKRTKTVLIKLDFVNQTIRVPELMYTTDEQAFILTANISLLLNKLSELSDKSNDPNGKLDLVGFYAYVQSKSKNGGISFPGYTLDETRTPRRLDNERLLPFSELINLDKYKGELNLYGPFLKMGQDRYVEYNKGDSFMLHYYFVSDDGWEKHHTSLAEIEKQACDNVSNGICGFEDDEEYLN